MVERDCHGDKKVLFFWQPRVAFLDASLEFFAFLHNNLLYDDDNDEYGIIQTEKLQITIRDNQVSLPGMYVFMPQEELLEQP